MKFKFRLKTKYWIGIFILLLLALIYWFWYLGSQTVAYDDIPDLTSEYNADAEIAKAQEALNGDVKAATVYTRDPAKNNAIALTFDGLPDPTTTAKLVDLIKKYDINVTFFVEGSNCAGDKGSVMELYKAGIPMQNYTYSGLMRLDRQPSDSVLEQLIKTQKVVETLTGTAPTMFKAPSTSYVVPLLKMAGASGLKSAVKTDVFVNKDAIKTDADAVNFINSVPQGSIVSMVLTTPVNSVVYQPGDVDEPPAVDKQPNLTIRDKPKIEHENIIDVTERLFKAIKARSLATVPLDDMREIEREDILLPQPAPAQQPNPAAPPAQNQQPAPTSGQQQPAQAAPHADNGMIASIINDIGKGFDSVFFHRAYAAAVDNSRYDVLRAQNNKKLAESPKMIYTTKQSVAYVFAGLDKPQVVYKTLAWLKKNDAKGTFLIMDKDIRQNPQLVRDIVNSGNETAIGVRSLKDGNYYTTCRQIATVQNALADMGVQTNLVMQPWGQITDETREAVSAMGCQMFSPTINIVSSKDEYAASADEIMKTRFGRLLYSLGRGWIVYFRLDFYQNDDLAVNVMDLVKRYKIDNIAYNSFTDDPKTNPANDSVYTITSIGDILSDKADIYQYNGGTDEDYPVDGKAYVKQRSDISFNDFIYKRYIGNKAVEDDNMFGFSVEEKKYRDLTGLIHTNDPVVFFTFDDWGTDQAINHLLYVFRKHHAKGTFFILTHNILNNPNLLRAIANDGHDIASHSEWHHPMDGTDYKTAYDNYLIDYGTSYAKLTNVLGDMYHADGSPVFRPYFRPPTLTASRAGFRALYDTGFTYIVSGSYSTHDYEQHNLAGMVEAVKEGIYDENGHVIKGAVLVMHMSDQAAYTAAALDMLMTENDKRADGDPAKFIPVALSSYLEGGYDQSDYGDVPYTLPDSRPVGSEPNGPEK